MLPLALNHMAAPRLRWDVFMDLARGLGCAGVEFRNDIPGRMFDGDAPDQVKAAAKARGLRILSIAELKPFNAWSEARHEEAEKLMWAAAACGAEAVSLIPRCDGQGRGSGERQANLRLALRELNPMLEEWGLIGLIEPLGFEVSSLRYKEEAAETIDALGVSNRFKLIHDTFHHVLAGGGPVFARHTGLVHVSGVVNPVLSIGEMQDRDRVLVDRNDRLGNADQIKELHMAGYRGPISLEPFAPSVHAFADPAKELAGSFSFIASLTAETAA